MKRLIQVIATLLLVVSGQAFASPTITNVLIVASTSSTATISWTTALPATSQLLYGPNQALQYSNTLNTSLVTSHSMTLTLLVPNQIYYVAALSKDSTGITQSTPITFSLCGGPTVTVQGTSTNYYQYGTYSMTWVPPTGSALPPTVCGQSFSTTVSGATDGSGSFNDQVSDASKIVPGPGTWAVTVRDAGNIAPITVNAYLSPTLTNVSQQLQVAAAASGLQNCQTNVNTSAYYPSTCGTGGGGGVAGVASLNALTGVLQLVPGSNIGISQSGNQITISATGISGGVTSVNSITGAVTFNAGTNISLTQSGSSITINSTGGGGTTGVSALNSLTGSLTLAAGTNVGISQSGNVITISASGSGSGGVTTFNGRAGAVAPTTGDYTAAQVTGAATSGANSNITSLTGLTTPLTVAQGGTGNGMGAAQSLAVASALPNLTTATTQTCGANLNAIATGQYVVNCAGGSGSGNLSGSLTALYIPVASGTNTLINSLLSDTGTTLTYTGTGGLKLTGATPGFMSFVSGSGTLSALSAGSAGFVGPASGGTPYLIALPGTWTGGYLYAPVPSTLYGVNVTTASSKGPEWNMGGSASNYGQYGSGTWIIGTKAANNGRFTNIQVVNTSPTSCTTAPTINVTNITQSTTGTGVVGSTSGSAMGVLVDGAQTLTFNAGDDIGLIVQTTGSSCSNIFNVSAEAINL